MSKKIRIGNIYIGGGEKIAVQSMSTYKLSDTDNAVAQAEELESVGCDILRYSVLDTDDTKAISEIKKHVKMPIVADIHFDYKLALSAISSGADKIRINPGNIGGEDKVRQVAEALKSADIPCRVGSNTGSIEKEFLHKYGKNEISLGESALKHVHTLEKNGFNNIVISVKSSDVITTVKAYEYISERTDYPLHLGVTEAGTEYNGVIKNSMGIGALLIKGIGDTIRVSLSADPVREVIAGRSILSGLNLIDDQVNVVACPTCGRCEWDCMKFADEVGEYVKSVRKKLKIAVMGCVVNGPGEASDADIGIAGSKGECYIFKKGKIIKKIDKENARKEFFKEIDKCIQ
ncbi:MAG: flavodoxin-dependent (E)-4-hydroxy-3-methylbut-2-enyl-diphosphate synthase [Clostridia bacterium]|nr:flavodoxin-dependent (E)-4-hydroxy-3-methylbut-2-enyl-diphosphate synthase [Clostridia bacterium]